MQRSGTFSAVLESGIYTWIYHRGGGQIMNKEVLKILEKDARATPQQIATMTNLPVKEVEKYIEKAEKERVIVKYKTIVNWERLGEEEVKATIGVKIHAQTNVGFGDT